MIPIKLLLNLLRHPLAASPSLNSLEVYNRCLVQVIELSIVPICLGAAEIAVLLLLTCCSICNDRDVILYVFQR